MTIEHGPKEETTHHIKSELRPTAEKLIDLAKKAAKGQGRKKDFLEKAQEEAEKSKTSTS